ncbi:hypothetical protein IAT38_004663 [Cryptococcus sp. DSM 104549]
MVKDDEPHQQRLRFWKAHGKAIFQLHELAMGHAHQSTFFDVVLHREIVDRRGQAPPADVVVSGPPGPAPGPYHSWARHWMLRVVERGTNAGRKKRKVGRGKSAAKRPNPPSLFDLANAFLTDDSLFRRKGPRLSWQPCEPTAPDGLIYHTPQDPTLPEHKQPPASLYFHYPQFATSQFHSLFTLIKRHCEIDLFSKFNLYCDRSGKAKFAVPGDTAEECDDLLVAMATVIETMHSRHAKQVIIANNTVLFVIAYSTCWERRREGPIFEYYISSPIAITPGVEGLSQLPLLPASGDSVPDIKTLWQFFTPLDVLIALPTALGCPVPYVSAGALEEAAHALKGGEYGPAFDDLPAPPPQLPPPPPVPPHSSRLWMGQLGVEPATVRPTPPTPPPPQDIPKLTIRLDKLLGKGRLASAFTATVAEISHALSPHPLREGQQLVAKAVHLGALGWIPKWKYGYTYHEAWRAVCREVKLLSGPLDRVKQVRVAPRLYGVWRGGKDSEGDNWVVLLLEYCGEAVDIDQVIEETPQGNLLKAEIMGIYARMHEAGVVQGDVQRRHILRHEDGWLRIIDYEGGQQRPEEVGTEAAEAWETGRLLENGDVYELPAFKMTEVPDAKRHKSNAVGSALKKKRPSGPDYEKGIEYWDGVEASVDGVLGGFGTGPVPHIEQLQSRLMLLSILPSLSPFPNPLTPTPAPAPSHRRTALDVGAGIGRVTRHVLLPLFDDVVLVEPVSKFVREAYRSAAAGEWRDLPRLKLDAEATEGESEEAVKEAKRRAEEARKGRGKRVRFVKGGLQFLDPKTPAQGGEDLGIVGERREGSGGCGAEQVEYDVIWCQWCLGHLSHADLVLFLRRAHAALRKDQESYIFVKENCCDDGPGGIAQEFMDDEDSSLTRSSAKWLQVFADAGLEVVKEETQLGMPEELFTVKA